MALFNAAMSVRIAETIRDHYNDFFPSNKTAQYARKAQEAWQMLTNELNGEYGTNVTVKQVKMKDK